MRKMIIPILAVILAFVFTACPSDPDPDRVRNYLLNDTTLSHSINGESFYVSVPKTLKVGEYLNSEVKGTLTHSQIVVAINSKNIDTLKQLPAKLHILMEQAGKHTLSFTFNNDRSMATINVTE